MSSTCSRPIAPCDVPQTAPARRSHTALVEHQDTPGFGQNDLQLEVALPGPQGDDQSYRAHFLLHGTPNSLPLSSQVITAQQVAENHLGSFVIKNAQIGPIGEIQDEMQRSLMPCTFQRTVTVEIEN